VFLASSGTFSEVPGCFRKLPSFGTKKTVRNSALGFERRTY
jgi:hypothetical protein